MPEFPISHVQVSSYGHCCCSRHAGLPSFGKADLRAEGIQKFFETHECNSICHALGLPRVKNGKVIHDTSGQQRTLPVPNPNLIWELKKYCSEARD